MKSPTRPFLTLALLTASAHAWPFTERNTGSGTLAQSLDQPLAVQMDADRPLEIFTGGPEFVQMSTNVSGLLDAVRVILPLPDYDPYATGTAQVRFGSGRGAVGDIDGDGDMDIVYSATVLWEEDDEPGNVRVVACRNEGGGPLTRLWQIKTSSGLTNGSPAVRLADLDRDGDPDFIESSTGVRVRWNDGTGNHSTSTTLTTIPKTAPQIEVADYDGNGWPDVAVFGDVAGLHPEYPLWLTGRLTVFWNNSGTFTAQNIHDVEPGLLFYGSGQADLDGDGRMDLLGVRERPAGGSDLFWYRNTGGGFAAPVVLFSDSLQNNREIRFHPGDLDEDGVTDLVVSTKTGEVQWLRGTGGGAFAPAAVLRTGGSTGESSRLCVADLDGDGDLDILYGLGNTWLENQSIRVQPAASVAAWSGFNPSGNVKLAVGDLLNDGKDDLIVADGGAARIRWYASSGFGLQSPTIVATLGSAPLGITTGDYNGDGRTDLAWTTTNTLTQALRTSGGSWSVSAAASMFGITDILSLDMDRDGDTDILSFAPAAEIIRIHANNGSATTWLPQNVDTGIPSLKRIAAGQSIPGGRPEVVTLSGEVVNQHSHQNGIWTHSTIANQTGITGSAGVVIAEISDNLPGPEVIYALNTNAIYYRHADLNQPVLIVNTTAAINQLAAVDWNRDGFTDILSATNTGVFIHLHNRASIPGFSTPVHLLSGTSIQDLVIMRLNGDAYPDAVAAQAGTGQLHLITNRSAVVEVTASSPGTRNPLAGATGVAATLNCAHRGMRTQELRCAPASARFRFLRSNLLGGVDTPGTPLTQTEVDALVDHVAFREGDDIPPIQPTSPSGVSNGFFTLSLPEWIRPALAINNKQGRTIQLIVKLKSSAGSSSVQRFFVEHHPDESQWVELDAASNSNPLPARKNGTSTPVSTLFIVKTPTALENWRMTWFGQYENSGIAANDYDDDGDDVPNILEYVMSRNPRSATGVSESTGPVVMVVGGPADSVLADVRTLASFDPQVTVRLQASTTMQFWSNLAFRTGDGAWIGRTPAITNLSGGRQLYRFNTAVTPLDEPRLFMRLVAEENP